MDYKKFINYFKRWDGMHMLGLGTMAVGFLMLWLGGAYSYVMALLGAPFLAIGFVAFLYGNVGRASENDLLEQMKRTREGIHFEEINEDRHFRGRVPQILREELLDGYTFSDDESILIKKQRSGTIISSEYTVAKLAVLKDAFYIKTKTFSFISDKKEEMTYEILFDQIENAEVVRSEKVLTRDKKSYHVKTCDVVITYDGGKTLTLHRKDDIYADGLIDTIRYAIEDAKKRA